MPVFDNKLFMTKLEARFGNDYTFISGEVTSQFSRVKLMHKCGCPVDVQVKGFLSPENKGSCKICKPVAAPVSTRKLTEEDIKDRFNKIDEYEYVDGFINTSAHMNIIHTKCGNIFKASSHMFFGSKATRCPKCSNENRGSHLKKSEPLENALLNFSSGKDYEWLEEYRGSTKETHLIRHKLCGSRFLATPNSVHQNAFRCTTCYKSQYEYKISMCLGEMNVVFSKEYKVKELRGSRNPLSFDYAIKLKDDTYMLVEYDGAFHEKGDEIADSYDTMKDKFVEENSDKYCILCLNGNDYIPELTETINQLKLLSLL